MNNPKNVAIIGASKDKHKIGAAVFHNLINAGYKGEIFPVNPKYDKLFGATCYPDISSINRELDLVVIAVPAHFVSEVLREAVQKEVKEVIIISAGFSEIGKEGEEKEQELLEIINGSETRILGPNCLGIIVPANGINASFAAQTPKQGNIAFLSQSGAFNTAMLDKAAQADLGFSHFISIGNKADINELDFLHEWLNDESVEVIGMYLEEFTQPRKLLKLAEKSSKPIIILNPGKSKAAKSAISSHTGSLAGDDKITRAALEKAGILQIDSIEEMFVLLRLFSLTIHKQKSLNVGIVTNAGGPGIVATDLIETNCLQVAEISQDLANQLKSFLPEAASVRNPIDLLGDADSQRYKQTLEVLVNNSQIDTIITLLTPQYMTEPEKTAEAIIKISQQTNKLILPLFVGGEKLQRSIDLLEKNNLPVFSYLNDGISALAKVVHWQNKKIIPRLSVNLDNFVKLPQEVNLLNQRPGPLNYQLSTQLVNQAGIQTIPEIFSNNLSELQDFATKTGYPVVIKASTDQIVHKTDTKAIYLNISNNEELAEKFAHLQNVITQETGDESPAVLLQQQLPKDAGLELIVGINRSGDTQVYESDNGFGHVMLVGTGGIYTEVYQDTATALLPMDHHELESLVRKTKAYKIITGARGADELAFNKLIELLGKLQLLVISYPEITSIDINPVLLNTTEALALDVKIFL